MPSQPFVPADGSPVLQAPQTLFLGLISLPEGNQGPLLELS